MPSTDRPGPGYSFGRVPVEHRGRLDAVLKAFHAATEAEKGEPVTIIQIEKHMPPARYGVKDRKNNNLALHKLEAEGRLHKVGFRYGRPGYNLYATFRAGPHDWRNKTRQQDPAAWQLYREEASLQCTSPGNDSQVTQNSPLSDV